MSKKISYKGQIPIGEEERIKLATINGKTGYKITKFQLMSSTPGANKYEYVGKITKVPDTNIGPTVDFTNSDLLAVVYLKGNSGANDAGFDKIIIFDNEKFNQDIFVNITDASGGTTPCNYYIELETMSLSDLESTMLTLKSLRTVLD
tara:strand:- start:92 stop:535 length:444 start_codon:yes stop_codon:yes gene_type:complete